jgi:hypothetical protein
MRYWLINAIFTPKVGLFFNPFFFIDLAAWNPGSNIISLQILGFQKMNGLSSHLGGVLGVSVTSGR